MKNINPVNGVTALDLAIIQQHILGGGTLNTPYKLIAADANNDVVYQCSRPCDYTSCNFGQFA
ncbi:hypothetical protein MASR1M65_11180 [Saprospiraceae bacterium]